MSWVYECAKCGDKEIEMKEIFDHMGLFHSIAADQIPRLLREPRDVTGETTEVVWTGSHDDPVLFARRSRPVYVPTAGARSRTSETPAQRVNSGRGRGHQ